MVANGFGLPVRDSAPMDDRILVELAAGDRTSQALPRLLWTRSGAEVMAGRDFGAEHATLQSSPSG